LVSMLRNGIVEPYGDSQICTPDGALQALKKTNSKKTSVKRIEITWILQRSGNRGGNRARYGGGVTNLSAKRSRIHYGKVNGGPLGVNGRESRDWREGLADVEGSRGRYLLR